MNSSILNYINKWHIRKFMYKEYSQTKQLVWISMHEKILSCNNMCMTCVHRYWLHNRHFCSTNYWTVFLRSDIDLICFISWYVRWHHSKALLSTHAQLVSWGKKLTENNKILRNSDTVSKISQSQQYNRNITGHLLLLIRKSASV